VAKTHLKGFSHDAYGSSEYKQGSFEYKQGSFECMQGFFGCIQGSSLTRLNLSAFAPLFFLDEKKGGFFFSRVAETHLITGLILFAGNVFFFFPHFFPRKYSTYPCTQPVGCV